MEEVCALITLLKEEEGTEREVDLVEERETAAVTAVAEAIDVCR